MVPGGALTRPEQAPAPTPTWSRRDSEDRVVLLAGPGDSSDVVANYLASRGSDLVVIGENAQSRVELARRRARRIGWPTVVGQILFIGTLQPMLRRLGRHRREAILLAGSADTTRRVPVHRVASINGDEVPGLLRSLRPSVVVVHGTRIIHSRVLASAGCPVINMHAGITPRYRGVHGGYWALVEGHPEWVGTTVHLVDSGVDTGGILAQETFEVSREDTIATYPDLHLVHGLALLGPQLDKVRTGRTLERQPSSLAPGSMLFYHPTLWGYAWRRLRDGVR
jgi:uncharacterized membrane protein YgdD (TMEM256/DUF423 family)